MLKKVAKIFVFLFIITVSTTAYSKIREVMTIEEYSKQFLDENFMLEDIKLEKIKDEAENKSEDINKKNLNENSEGIIDLDSNENLKKHEEIDEEDISDEKYEKEIEEEIKKDNDRKVIAKKIDWTLPNNFRAVIIGDLKGNVFYSKNADKIYPLASVTKMMTLMVTFDEINSGRISLRDKVKVSKRAATQGGSRISMKSGQIFRLEDLIKASAIYSANNATYAIAEYVGKGSLDNFVKKMNRKVRKLGLQKDLKYFTPAGLPSRMTKQPMDSGTARAIYKLSIEALKYKKYIKIAGIKRTKIRDGRISLKNRNHLLGKNGVYGLKTGYHREARYNIAVASKQENTDVIVVVMGGKTYKGRDKVVLDILNIFKNNYKTVQVLNRRKVIGKVNILDTNKKAAVVPDRNYKITIKKSEDFRIEIKQRGNIKLNVFKGEDLGEYIVYVGDKEVLRGRLRAERGIKR